MEFTDFASFRLYAILIFMNEESKVDELLRAVRGKSPLLILTHNNPDPDGLASGWALKLLLETKADVVAKIAYGGTLGREENRSLNRLLRVGAVRLLPSHFKKFPCVALVDCQPGGGNNSLPAGKTPLIVIDHHPRLKSTQAAYIDIQPDCGATSTILVEYLRAAEVDIPQGLSTALYYALISETQHLGRDVTQRDIAASIFLFPRAKHRLLSRIEHPVHNREFFQQLHSALEKAFTYQKFIGAQLGEIRHPDFVAQLADLLVSLKRSTWCFVTGRYRDSLHCSLRTTHPRARAGRILRKVIGARGSAGGHEMMAGGQVPLKGMSPEEKAAVEKAILKKLIKNINLPEEFKPTPLIIPEPFPGRR